MLYAAIDKQRWDDIPSGWDEVRDMFRYLHKMTYAHQLTFEARMFALQDAAEYRCTLIKWEKALGSRDERKRTVLLETTDPRQMKAALLMLISEAEPEYKAAKMQWVQYER